MAFHFTDDEWDAIAGFLERVGRLRYDGDRETLETVCDGFAQTRPTLGRNSPAPARARDAWLRVATATQRLEAAIAGLRKAGAADFTVLDNHQGGVASWAAQLPLVMRGAKEAAELEMQGVRRGASNSDPLRDGFLKQLMVVWRGFGGRVSYAENGPCVRFLATVSGSALRAIGEKPLTVDKLRAAVRRLRVAS
jgi:hypothetical protein